MKITVLSAVMVPQFVPSRSTVRPWCVAGVKRVSGRPRPGLAGSTGIESESQYGPREDFTPENVGCRLRERCNPSRK